MGAKLTELGLRSLDEGMHWDALLPAFGVRVGKRRKTFLVVRDHGRRVRIGLYPQISLQEARSKAREILSASTKESAPIAYLEAVERFLEAKGKVLRERSLIEYARPLRAFKFSTSEPSAGEVRLALDGIAGNSARAHAYTALKVLFNWCVQYDYCERNPLDRVAKPAGSRSRERVLSDDEIAAVWRASFGARKFGAIVRLLLLTGQRKGQFARFDVRWIQVDRELIVFPASAMKGKREHVLPLTRMVAVALRGLEPGVFSGWSKCKIRLDSLAGIEPWTIHDLRRTWASLAARLEVPPHVIARVLSHQSPEGKVAGIYNRYLYEKEMREALEKVSGYITQLVRKNAARVNEPRASPAKQK